MPRRDHYGKNEKTIDTRILKFNELVRIQQCIDSMADSVQYLSIKVTAFQQSISALLPITPLKRSTKLISIAKVSEMLEVSKPQVYKLIKEGKIQAVRIGARGIRITEDSVSAFIVEQTIAPHELP